MGYARADVYSCSFQCMSQRQVVGRLVRGGRPDKPAAGRTDAQRRPGTAGSSAYSLMATHGSSCTRIISPGGIAGTRSAAAGDRQTQATLTRRVPFHPVQYQRQMYAQQAVHAAGAPRKRVVRNSATRCIWCRTRPSPSGTSEAFACMPCGSVKKAHEPSPLATRNLFTNSAAATADHHGRQSSH